MSFSVSFDTMDTYPRGVWKWNHYFAVTRLKCAWTDANTLASELYDGVNTTYPYNDSGATVVDVGIEPLKRSATGQATTTYNAAYSLSSLTGYVTAVLTVKYSTLGPRWVNGKLVTETLRTFTDIHRLSHRGLVFGVGTDARPLHPNEAPFQLQPGMVYAITYHRLASFPLAVSTVEPGTVNQGAIVAPVMGVTFPPETLVYMGAQVHHATYIFGTSPYTVTYMFRYKCNENRGWNWCWNQELGEFMKVKLPDGNQVKPQKPASTDAVFE